MSRAWFLPDYTKQAESVVMFNSVANKGNIVSSEYTRSLQVALIKEEFEEVCEAYAESDKEGFLKELCDLFVVSSFMVYLRDKDEFYDPNCFVFNRKCGAPPVTMSLDIISDMIQLHNWNGLVKTVIGLLTLIDADSVGATNAVANNNLSKFIRYESRHLEEYDRFAKEIELNSKGRYTGVQWEQVADRVVFRDAKGKIMKPIGYKPVDLSGYIKGAV